MSDELEKQLIVQLDKFQKLMNVLKWFMFGAFSLGVWVTTLEVRAGLSSENKAAISAIKDAAHAQQLKLVEIQSKQEQVLKTLEEIKGKL